jgi:retron-type reverse transcriptase
MLDVQKAFDSVDHHLLCEKIRLAGMEPDWFRSYLSNRKQTVCVNGVFSSQKTIQCGVPQGSILGPLCYLLYCNDMPSCVKCKMIMYADDTILIVSHKNLDQLSNILSDELSHCFHWLANNRLSMHKGKTEALIISTKRKQHHTKDYQIKHEE